MVLLKSEINRFLVEWLIGDVDNFFTNSVVNVSSFIHNIEEFTKNNESCVFVLTG